MEGNRKAVLADWHITCSTRRHALQKMLVWDWHLCVQEHSAHDLHVTCSIRRHALQKTSATSHMCKSHALYCHAQKLLYYSPRLLLWPLRVTLSQLCYEPVVTYCMVFTSRITILDSIDSFMQSILGPCIESGKRDVWAMKHTTDLLKKIHKGIRYDGKDD